MMRILNVHEREVKGAVTQVGQLIDTLGSQQDALWPRNIWPHMKFEGPLAVGVQGGHGPIKYYVEAYEPGKRIQFRFTGPKGFSGSHSYEVEASAKGTLLRHRLEMKTRGWAVLTWPIVFRPLHDALIEDSFATAQLSVGQSPQMRAWSSWVRFLRWTLSGGHARAQATSNIVYN